MSRYQLINTKTGEIVWPRPDQAHQAKLDRMRTLWAAEDRLRGIKPRTTRRKRQNGLHWEEIAAGVLVGMFLVMYVVGPY